MPKHDLINQMLENITDPQLREMYGNIASGRYTHQVRCNSKSCKGRVIGRRMQHSVSRHAWVDDPVEEDGLPVSGVASSRERFDGNTGFRCWCGNDSILAGAEKGVIGAQAPSASDLNKIAERLDNEIGTPLVDGKKTVDGFTVERLT